MTKIKQQLKKGILEIAILGLLENRNYYGYELISDLKEKSNDVFTLKEGTMYPILYRLEDNKLITSYWETVEKSRSKPRKYYAISEEGKQVFKEALGSYNEMIEAMNKILGKK